MRRYTINKIFRFDENTVGILKKNVEKRNKAVKKKISESEYVRNLILKDNFEQLTVGVDREAYGDMIRIMAGIGNNLNQIAHKMNMDIYDKTDIETIKDTKEQMLDIKALLQEVVTSLRNGDWYGIFKIGTYKRIVRLK